MARTTGRTALWVDGTVRFLVPALVLRGLTEGLDAVECNGSRKTIDTQIVPFTVTAPTPIWVKSWSRMFALCAGLCMKALKRVLTSGP